MQGPTLGLHLSGARSAGTVDTSRVRHRAAVLGRPIGHSLSPVLHHAAYRALGLEGWTYDAIDCGAAELGALVADAGPEWAGFSVTMPGKRAAFDVADRRTAGAELVGAANTLLPGADGWTAANTDVDGIVGALGPFLGPAARRADDAATAGELGPGGLGREVALLGAGGTAQAALVALRRLGTDYVHVIVRDPARAMALRATADRAEVDLVVHPWGSAEADSQLSRAEVLISTMPAQAADPLAARAWSDRVVILDTVYADWPTALARAVTRAGGQAVSGLEMLLHQAAEQVRLMTGHPAPVDAMRAALLPQ